MNIFATLSTELKRFWRGSLTKVAVLIIVLFPLIYGALYLWAYWSPTTNMGSMPVALVNEDQPATTSQGEQIDVGKQLVENLQEDGSLGWRLVDAKTAADGVSDGDYYFSLVIPSDFSSTIAAAGTDAAAPAKLQVTYNDANSYLATTLGKSAMTKVRDSLAQQTSEQTANGLLVGINTLSDGIHQASDGSAQLADGSTQLVDGSGQLVVGMNALASGAVTLNTGAAQLATGADKLAVGTQQAKTGSAQLAAGAQTLAQGTQKTDSGAQQLSAGVQSLSQKYDGLVNEVSAANSQVQAHRDTIQRVGQDAQTLSDQLATLNGGPNTPETQAALGQAIAGLKAIQPQTDQTAQAIARLEALKTLLNSSGSWQQISGDLSAGAKTLEGLPDRLNDAQQQVVNGQDAIHKELVPGAQQLAAGTQQVTEGAQTLAQKAGELSAGVGQLNDGAQQLSDGATKLAGGTGDLVTGTNSASSGASQLNDGTQQLNDGAQELSGKLSDGAAKAPSFSDESRESNAKATADPVQVDANEHNLASALGQGFAPMFTMLALFVGGVINWLVLRPFPKRPMASNASGFRTVMAGFAPAIIMGIAQAVILFVVLQQVLGLDAQHPVWLALFMVLVSLSFLALQQMLIIVFGSAPGRVVSIILLMLQLTSAGGTYPIETTPAFFQALHPYMPGTYAIEGMRQLTVGGIDGRMTGCIGFLLGMLIVALTISSITAARQKVWNMTRLHPEIEV
ncbi:YhgE/Pip domain-containing protein [Pseudoclavibacter sp. CFCC 14310]|uniref:YhgE/Pip domain-containing protein n=1 Tax=Pseudoclavibacter sp. CFCC 14310 TaxID=2615180 RepID=UPI001300E9A6|nr:YhgE/Pip domain-containing protein [Pseudoclavibacter sp. CFCC 14310]KAB1647514.1 YhgE/Pip domain-containing protein [Pseudoclavibacter sp. CFCC 14310]